MRPTVGMSIGGISVLAPSFVALAWTVPRFGVPTYDSQCGGMPACRTSSGSDIRPPTGAPPLRVHSSYRWPGIDDALLPQPTTFL
jgi:hypothetical protein